jgi:uncharacterized protein YdiU (UPF0061 family)
MMANKMGLDEVRPADTTFIQNFEKMLKTFKPDMTIFFQMLIDLVGKPEEKNFLGHFKESFYHELKHNETDEFNVVMESYLERVKTNTISKDEAMERMRKNNPRFILRNYLLHQSIEQLEKGDDTLFLQLQKAMKDPYSKRFDEFFAKRPEWATQKAGCSMLSCSS